MERPLLCSACFSLGTYTDKQDVYLAVGSIMNEIIIWKPFAGSVVERRFIGHDVCLDCYRFGYSDLTD